MVQKLQWLLLLMLQLLAWKQDVGRSGMVSAFVLLGTTTSSCLHQVVTRRMTATRLFVVEGALGQHDLEEPATHRRTIKDTVMPRPSDLRSVVVVLQDADRDDVSSASSSSFSRRDFLGTTTAAASCVLLAGGGGMTGLVSRRPANAATTAAVSSSRDPYNDNHSRTSSTSSSTTTTTIAASASSSTGVAAPSAVPIDWSRIGQSALKKAVGGGKAGAAAAVVQVCSLMWLRTSMNYQYRYGGTLQSSLQTLWQQGGVTRLYQGLPFALVQGPLTRFGDTAANVGILALLETLPTTQDWPLPLKTACGSAAAGLWRIVLSKLVAWLQARLA
jgi:hypothetical protein